MTKLATAFLVLGLTSVAAMAGDLSKYRSFQLGSDLATVAKQTGTSLSQAKTIHLRPTLLQELEWRPQPLGLTTQTESAQKVVFSFLDGTLFQIVVNYDRYETEGLTADDFTETISATYGIAARPAASVQAGAARYDDPEVTVARWQDPQYRFDLIRAPYGPTFRLVGVLKRLEAPAQAALLEAKRLDDQEAPQRDAARMVSDEAASKAKLEKARLLNKTKFRL